MVNVDLLLIRVQVDQLLIRIIHLINIDDIDRLGLELIGNVLEVVDDQLLLVEHIGYVLNNTVML